MSGACPTPRIPVPFRIDAARCWGSVCEKNPEQQSPTSEGALATSTLCSEICVTEDQVFTPLGYEKIPGSPRPKPENAEQGWHTGTAVQPSGFFSSLETQTGIVYGPDLGPLPMAKINKPCKPREPPSCLLNLVAQLDIGIVKPPRQASFGAP